MSKINVAIDGFSGCGKSTLAQDLASKLGYTFVDTGAMYRAIAYLALETKMAIHEGVDAVISLNPSIEFNAESNDIIINGINREKEIRGGEVAKFVSDVAAIGKVRSYLLALQQNFIADKGIVMEGRDIGSVIMPNAELKLFITAHVDIRSQRRHDQLIESGKSVSMSEVRQNLLDRDEKDMTRKEAPLVLTQSAIVLDTSYLTREEQVKCALALIRPMVDPDNLLAGL